MTRRLPQRALRRLHTLAHTQGGYFTAKQAAKLGYDYPHLGYHRKVGNIERAGHGLYRLVTIPVHEHDDLVQLSLWSRDRGGQPQATASHVTALVLHGLTDLLPRSTHLTVPRRFQKPTPRGCVLHRAELSDDEIEQHDGHRVTTPLRTLLDAAQAPDVPQDELAKAVALALERGLVRERVLRAALERSAGRDRLSRALGIKRKPSS